MRVILIRICTSIEQSLLVEPLISVAELQSYSRGIGSELLLDAAGGGFRLSAAVLVVWVVLRAFLLTEGWGMTVWNFFSEIVQKLEPIPRKLISPYLIFFATFSLGGMKWIKVV